MNTTLFNEDGKRRSASSKYFFSTFFFFYFLVSVASITWVKKKDESSLSKVRTVVLYHSMKKSEDLQKI